MTKVTYRASADIALVKYWGKKDEVLRLPENGSVSIILDGLDTTTTLELDPNLTQDEIVIEGLDDAKEIQRTVDHLDRVRALAGRNEYVRMHSRNSFPTGTGLSSSGSGFAALTYAAVELFELRLTEREMSILARQGSGTACRCVCGGFVEWKNGNTSDTSYSETLFPADYWDIRDVIAVISEDRKRISSTEGHTVARTSPFFEARQQRIEKRIADVKHAIAHKDFEHLGELVEAEALEFHSILLTSRPSILMLYPGTLAVCGVVRELRRQGVPAYFTINTGFNVHVLTVPPYEERVKKTLEELDVVQKTITAKVGGKPTKIEK